MTKKECILNIADKMNMSNSVVEAFLEATAQTIREAFAEDEDITFPYLGKFSSKIRAERIGQPPKTGEAITILNKKVVGFKASSFLNEALNKALNEQT